MLQFYPWAEFGLQLIMQAAVMLAFVLFVVKYRRDRLFVLLTLMFFQGLFIFLGASIHNLYKIVVLLFTLYCVSRRGILKIESGFDKLWLSAFALFSVAFFMSAIQNIETNTFTIVFSQYSRYVETFCLYFILRHAVTKCGKSVELLNFFFLIFLTQIIISVLKLILFQGRQIEGLVGTMSIVGGAMGTSIPILGFIVIWFYRNGKLSKKDWLFVLGLLIIGFTTGKRAIWFILPSVIAAFMIIVQGMRLKYMILAIVIAPVLLYFGARLTPSLNPDNKVWGTFDLGYVFDYAEYYQFGDDNNSPVVSEPMLVSVRGGKIVKSEVISAAGRGGASFALLELLFSDRPLRPEDIWGIGFSNMYSVDYEAFGKLPLSISIDHKGSATGLFQSYVTMGVVGVVATIFFGFLPFFFFRQKRLQWVLFAIVLWEYFMYTGMFFRTPAFMSVFLFLLVYTNYLHNRKVNLYETVNNCTGI